MTEERLGFNPLKSVIRDTRKEKPSAKKKSGKVELTEAEERFFADIDRGVKHVYVGKRGSQEGVRMKRVLVHLPYDYVEQLRTEAEIAIPRKTISEVIREKLGV